MLLARQSGDPLAAERVADRAAQYYRQERAAQQRFAGLSGTEQQLWAGRAGTRPDGFGRDQRIQPQFADITSAQALQLCRQQEPAAACSNFKTTASCRLRRQQLEQFQQQRGAVSQQRVAVGTQEFHRVAELHDQAFMAGHPELVRDPAKFRETQVAAQKYLTEKGLSKEETGAALERSEEFQSAGENNVRTFFLTRSDGEWRRIGSRNRAATTNNCRRCNGLGHGKIGVSRCMRSMSGRGLGWIGRGAREDAARELQAMRRLGARR